MNNHFILAKKIDRGRTFIVAEISANHNGKLAKLKKIMLEAKKVVWMQLKFKVMNLRA